MQLDLVQTGESSELKWNGAIEVVVADQQRAQPGELADRGWQRAHERILVQRQRS